MCAHVCACVGGEPGRVHTCVPVWDAASLPLQVLGLLPGRHPGGLSVKARCVLGFTVVSGPLACVLCHRWGYGSGSWKLCRVSGGGLACTPLVQSVPPVQGSPTCPGCPTCPEYPTCPGHSHLSRVPHLSRVSHLSRALPPVQGAPPIQGSSPEPVRGSLPWYPQFNIPRGPRAPEV